MGERKREKLRWEKKRRYVWVKEINWDEEKNWNRRGWEETKIEKKIK